MIEENKKNQYKGVMPADGSFAFICAILGSLFISVILVLFIRDENTLNWVYSFVSQTFFMATAYFYTYKACRRDCPDLENYRLNSFHALGYTKKPKASLAILTVLLAVFSIVAFLPVSEGVAYLFYQWGYEQTPGYADYTSSVWVYLLGILGLCIFPAFGEESVFRGTLMRGLRSKGTIYAITMSALMFALMHGSPVQFIHQFLIGIIMAFLVILTDSIWYSVIFHFTNNFIVVTFEFALTQAGMANLEVSWWILLALFVSGIIGLYCGINLFVIKYVKGTDSEEKINQLISEKGKVGDIIKAIFDTSDYKYCRYDKRDRAPVLVALLIVLAIWILNTVLGWVQV